MNNSNAEFDPNFTQRVINATGPNATPRVRQVVSGLIQHLHDFMRENRVTMEEFLIGVALITDAGRRSDDTRNEVLLLFDTFGLESLADEISSKLAPPSSSATLPTDSAILGPFWRSDTPVRPMGSSIVLKETTSIMEGGEHAWIHGKVTDFHTGAPVKGATLDVWETAPNGMYEQQDSEQPEFNLRGKFVTGDDGTYDFYCLRPTPYPIPYDGPTGRFLKAVDRHPWRPGHVHFQITADGYKPLTTQIYDKNSKYVDSDTVFGVKDSLIIDFQPLQGNPKAKFELAYNFQMASLEDAKKFAVA